VAVLELREGEFEFLDNYEGVRVGRERLFPVHSYNDRKRIGGF
jgi:dihydroorotase